MNGNEFKDKRIDIESKVEYINSLLQKGDTVGNIRKTLGVGINYIADNFKKAGYVLNRNINQYVKVDSDIENTNVVITNTINSKENKKPGNTNTKDKDYKVLESKIKDLEEQIKLINTTLDTIQANNTSVVTDTTNIIHKDVDKTQDTTVSSYRIYKDIHKEFKTFCDNNKQHKRQDILSSAIKEYLDKYNK